jgi:hypothetical protein
VARGDLGVEPDRAQIALVQERIIAVANARGRPVVTATHLLESMIEHQLSGKTVSQFNLSNCRSRRASPDAPAGSSSESGSRPG